MAVKNARNFVRDVNTRKICYSFLSSTDSGENSILWLKTWQILCYLWATRAGGNQEVTGRGCVLSFPPDLRVAFLHVNNEQVFWGSVNTALILVTFQVHPIFKGGVAMLINPINDLIKTHPEYIKSPASTFLSRLSLAASSMLRANASSVWKSN